MVNLFYGLPEDLQHKINWMNIHAEINQKDYYVYKMVEEKDWGWFDIDEVGYWMYTMPDMRGNWRRALPEDETSEVRQVSGDCLVLVFISLARRCHTLSRRQTS